MATMTTGGKKHVERKNVQKLSPNLKLEDMKEKKTGDFFPSVKPNMSQVFISWCVCMKMSRQLT